MRVFSGQPQVPQYPAAIIREIHLVLAFPPDRSKVPGTNASGPSAVHQRPSAVHQRPSAVPVAAGDPWVSRKDATTQREMAR